jgi:gamma-glutamylcyclotransferase (GGCT)/AIG2-like uncharacterized protein YtfP
MPLKLATYNLFVYGTLTDPAVFRAVLGKRLVAEKELADGVETYWACQAVLNGYKKVSPDSTYLYAVEDKGHRIHGYLIRNLPGESFRALRKYEGKNYSRRRVQVQTSEGMEDAYVFVGNLRQLEHHFGYSFRDPLKQEILLKRKIDRAIRETEQTQLNTDEALSRKAVEELSGATIRDLVRRHFEAGGISEFAIRHHLKDRQLPDFKRLRSDRRAEPFIRNYLRLVIRQVVFNQFEERIRQDFRYELDHLPGSEVLYERIISSLVALRILNQNATILDVIVADILGDMNFQTSTLIDYIRRAIIASDAMYDSRPIESQINFVRGHLGFGYIPLGAELEFSNIGHAVIRDPSAQSDQDPVYDGFLYFYDFALDMLTWKLGGHVDDHREKAPGKPRRGFFEVALGNLSIEANISKPITRDPWVLNQLIHHTMRFFPIRPHSLHLSMQLRSQHKPDRERLLPLYVLKCLFALAGDPLPLSSGQVQVRRLSEREIVQDQGRASMLFSDISKRFSQRGEGASAGEEGRYVQQFRFARLSPTHNYEPIVMGLKGIHLSLRPGTFLTATQYESSRRHRETFENLMGWAAQPEPLAQRDIDQFLTHIRDGLMTEKRGRPAHSQAYIAWSLSQLGEQLKKFNALLEG